MSKISNKFKNKVYPRLFRYFEKIQKSEYIDSDYKADLARDLLLEGLITTNTIDFEGIPIGEINLVVKELYNTDSGIVENFEIQICRQQRPLIRYEHAHKSIRSTSGKHSYHDHVHYHDEDTGLLEKTELHNIPSVDEIFLVSEDFCRDTTVVIEEEGDTGK